MRPPNAMWRLVIPRERRSWWLDRWESGASTAVTSDQRTVPSVPFVTHRPSPASTRQSQTCSDSTLSSAGRSHQRSARSTRVSRPPDLAVLEVPSNTGSSPPSCCGWSTPRSVSDSRTIWVMRVAPMVMTKNVTTRTVKRTCKEG